MNEFVAFLQILWEIVKRLLDAATYLICSVLAVLACVLPWRAVAVLRLLHAKELSRPACVFQFFRTIGEALCFAFCLPSLIIPTRFAGFARLLLDAEYMRQLVSDDDADYLPFLLASPFIGIAEVFSGICGLVALLSVVRIFPLVQEVKQAATGSKWNAVWYNEELVGTLIANGVMGFLDVMLLPLFLLLSVTVWRAPPMFRAMRKGFTMATRAIIFKQFVRLLIDILLVGPSVLLVSLTVYRLPPLLRRLTYQRPVHDEEMPLTPTAALEDASAEAECSAVFQLEHAQHEPIRAAGLILLDIACLPMLLPLLVTGYRFSAIAGGLPGTQFHSVALTEFGNLALDAPFLLAGFLVVCSIYRADLALRLCKSNAGTAWERRRAAGRQLLRVMADVASLAPCAVIICTLYRACSLALNLKASMTQILRAESEMHLQEWQFDMPRPKGKPRFVLRAAKSPNLSDVTSMQLQIAGDGFWEAVAQAHGGIKAAVGRAMLPLRLKDGKEVDFSSVQHGRTDAELVIELDCAVKQSSVLKFLQKLPGDTELLLQLEASLGARRQKAVLLAVPYRLSDLVEAVSSEGLQFQVQHEEEHSEATAERLAALRGIPKARRDAWFPVVMTEFLQVVIDFVHLLIAVLLLAMPWRLTYAIFLFLEPTALHDARPVRRTLAMIAAWDRACDRIMARAEGLANRYAKAAAEEAYLGTRQAGTLQCRNSSGDRGGLEVAAEGCVGTCCCIFCPCCPNYNDFDYEDWEVVRSNGHYVGRSGGLRDDFDQQLQKLGASLKFFRALLQKARKAWPDTEAWAEISSIIDAHLQQRSESFFLMLLLHEVHILRVNHKITDQQHARVAQAIRNRALPLVHQVKSNSDQLQEAFKLQFRAASAEGTYGCKGKSKALLFSILRGQLKSAVTDLLSVLLVLLLVVTIYRLPRIREELGQKPDLAYMKSVVKREAFSLAQDLLRLLQLLLLTSILVATVVKLPDFLSTVQPARGLRSVRDCALAAVTELAVGVGELILMLTAWKTYRLLVSASVFGILCPAAMLAVALPGSGMGTRCRFWIASVCWLGLVLASCLLPGTPILMVFSLMFLVLAFSGFIFNQVAGWAKPRGGQDWWSPVVRCTLPNFLALLGIVGDSLALAWVGVHGGTVSGIDLEDIPLAHTAPQVALGVVGVTILLETIPMVSSEADQADTVTSHTWRAASSICKEVLFVLVVAVMAPGALDNWVQCVSLVFYITVSLLGPAVWDVDLPYGSQLDIRCVGLCASGRRLFMACAIVAGALNRPDLFVALALASGAWALGWAPYGCASLWPEVLRLGAIVGSVVAAVAGHEAVEDSWRAVSLVWAGACVLALCIGLSSLNIRRHRLAASKVGTAFAHLAELQRRLCLWGGEGLPALQADTDVKGTARRLLEFEERLPMERLDPAFFTERHTWRKDLADAKDYDIVLAHLEKLKTMIREPVTRVLLRQLLACTPISGYSPPGKQLGRPLASEIVGFAVPQIAITLPAPPRGWEYGRLDLATLRSQAAQRAQDIPRSLDARAALPKRIGRSRAVLQKKRESVMTTSSSREGIGAYEGI